MRNLEIEHQPNLGFRHKISMFHEISTRNPGRLSRKKSFKSCPSLETQHLEVEDRGGPGMTWVFVGKLARQQRPGCWCRLQIFQIGLDWLVGFDFIGWFAYVWHCVYDHSLLWLPSFWIYMIQSASWGKPNNWSSILAWFITPSCGQNWSNGRLISIDSQLLGFQWVQHLHFAKYLPVTTIHTICI